MCANYWNLDDVAFTCLACKAKTTDALQTHFMGDASFDNYYRIGEPVKELGDITVTLGDPATGAPDDFIGGCDECGAFLDFAATIVNGVVTAAWPYRVAP